MKIRHVYTVVREYEIKKNDLEDEIDSFQGRKEEAGEYLYGGGSGDESIMVSGLWSPDGKTWHSLE